MLSEIDIEIRNLIRSHTNEHVDDWKSSGKPVIGYFCQYMPPEIIYALGALPLRFRAAGSDDSSFGDAFMSGRVCTYVRHVMSLVLDEKYNFLDGEITVNTCDHIRRAADIFTKKSNIPYHGFISVPRNQRESLFDYYLKEIKKIISELSEHLGVSFKERDIIDAIKTYNKIREKLRKINEYRREKEPRLTGANGLSLHIASQVLPPEVFLEIADRYIDYIENEAKHTKPQARFIVTGTELDEPKYFEAIESQGGVIVADQICFGEQFILDPIDEVSSDPVETLAKAYFFKTSCARMIGGFDDRFAALKKLYKDVDADGVIFQRLIFCDPWGAELHNIQHSLKKENDFPVLSLSREYGIVATGQVKTRVQAFMEKIEISKAQNGGM